MGDELSLSDCHTILVEYGVGEGARGVGPLCLSTPELRGSPVITWAFYPKSAEPTLIARQVVGAFEDAQPQITSTKHKLNSNGVLAHVKDGLGELGFNVEACQKAAEKIRIRLLFGRKGRPEKSFDADAFHAGEGFVIEVEAGRAYTNHQFLKDLFEACMMHNVHYVAIAVRQDYRKHRDFEAVCTFFDTLYASGRLSLPLRGVLLLGY